MELVQNVNVVTEGSNNIVYFALLDMSLHLFQQLPAPVKRRIKALKKIQLEATNIEAKFYEEVHLLECKYHKLYTPLYEKV